METRSLTVVVLAANAVLWPAAAHAEVVVFDNSAGEFAWQLSNDECPGCLPGPYHFDVTAPPNAQPTSGVAGRSLLLLHHRVQFNVRPGHVLMTAWREARFTGGNCNGAWVPPSAAMQTRIGPWGPFNSCGWVAYLQAPSSDNTPSQLLFTDDVVGLRILIDGQPHFGWVELHATITTPLDFTAQVTVTPLRWAYETRPNVPIAMPGRCTLDLDSDGSFTNGGTPDSAVTIDDLLFMLAAFEAGDLQADLDDDGEPAVGAPDGAVTIEDLLFFLARFEAGC